MSDIISFSLFLVDYSLTDDVKSVSTSSHGLVFEIGGESVLISYNKFLLSFPQNIEIQSFFRYAEIVKMVGLFDPYLFKSFCDCNMLLMLIFS